MFQSEYAGKCIEVFGTAGGEMTDMFQRGDQTHLRVQDTQSWNDGLCARAYSMFPVVKQRCSITSASTGAYRGEFGGRKNGSMIAHGNGKVGSLCARYTPAAWQPIRWPW